MSGWKRRRTSFAFGTALACVWAIGFAVPSVGQDKALFTDYAPRPKPPKGAPNILVIMTDDVGFGASSTFGGPIPTPNLDELAKRGLRYNRFNTSAMCSPTRAALLTGRNPHSVGFGELADNATPTPGYHANIPASAATFAQVLGSAGYDTAMFGKHHNVPAQEDMPVGPFKHWPIGLGFNYFYGFIGGATNQFTPNLVENLNWREAPNNDPTYHLDRDLADRTIDWIRNQKRAHSETPFLVYYAPGTAHSPHQAPPDWIARFNGKFDMGWDKMREITFARQKAAGIIPPDTVLTPRPKELPAWASLRAEERKVRARMMEVYAAQLAYCDDQIGRIIQSLKDSGEYENTMIVFIQGDNGASLEGSPEGSVDEIARNKNRIPDELPDQIAHFADIGTRHSFDNYPTAWAWAMNTPFQWGKAIPSHLGGIRNGLVISWPGHIKGEGEIRNQFAHVTDIAPTLYEAAGIKMPATINGVEQMPLAGKSLEYTFQSGAVATRHNEQYFEFRQNVGYFKDGWFLASMPRMRPWLEEAAPPPNTPIVWGLYNLDEDFSQSRDLARRNPAKLAELKAAFISAARTYSIRFGSSADRVDAPLPLKFPTSTMKKYTYYQGDRRFKSFAPILNRSWRVEADMVAPEHGGDGAIAAQGGRLSGWALLILNGLPTFMFNSTIMEPDRVRIVSEAPLSPGRHKIDVQFDYDGGGLGKGGLFTMYVDGQKVGNTRIARTPSAMIAGEGGAEVGHDYGTTLSDEYSAPFSYPGDIKTVTIELDPQ